MNQKRTSLAKSASSEQILAATRRLLKRQGYRRTSIEDIAEESGLAKATLYLHFSGKNAIVRTLFERCRAEIDSRAAAAAAITQDVAGALAGVIEAHMGTAIEWFGNAEHLRELSRLIADDPESYRIPPETEMADRLSTILARAAALGQIAPKRPDAAIALIDVLQDCARGAKQSDTVDAQEFARRIRRAAPIILDGLFTSGEPRHEI